MASNHDNTAKRLAAKEHVEYNQGQGPDVNAPGRAIEVETANTVRDGIRQLQGFRKPVYIAGASTKATKAALEATQGTTVGVMDPNGKIVKRSTRRR